MMFYSTAFILGFLLLRVHGKARFTNSQFETVEVGQNFNLTWADNKGAVRLELTHGDKNNLIRTELIAENVGGNWYKWNPSRKVPAIDNVLKITDLGDHEPNYSLKFAIKGGNTSWAPAQDSDSSTGSDSSSGYNIPSNTVDDTPAKSGLSSTAKIAIAVATSVIAIVGGLCLGLWLRSKRNKSRRGNQPMRTMSTDFPPTRNNFDNSNYPIPTTPEKATRRQHNRSQTVSSGSTLSSFKRHFFNEKDSGDIAMDKVSPASTTTYVERTPEGSQPTSPSSLERGLVLGANERSELGATRDNYSNVDRILFPTRESELDASNERGYRPHYIGYQNDPGSPSPRPRVVSAPILDGGFDENQRIPPGSNKDTQPQHWELSAGTPYQSAARLPHFTHPQELPQDSQRRVTSSPLLGSSTSRGASRLSNEGSHSQIQIKRKSLSSAITFGDSDDPDVIVQHLATQREKIRMEKERLRKMQELDTMEEDLERRIAEARERRL